MSDARAEIEIAATTSRLSSGLRQATSMMSSWRSNIMGGMRRMSNEMGKSMASGFSPGALAGRGLDILANSARHVMVVEDSLLKLQVASGRSAAEMNELRDAGHDIAGKYGMDPAAIAEASEKYFDLTSDVKGAVPAMTSFARASKASFSDMKDVTAIGAAMSDTFGITGAEFDSAFSGLIAQASEGKVPFSELAREITGLAPKFTEFGATGRDGLMQLHAAYQVVAKGFGSGAEAKTGLESLIASLRTKSSVFEKAGVKIFNVGKDGTKRFRNFHDIIVDIGKSKLAQSPDLLAKAFGSDVALSAFNQLNRLPDLYNKVAAAGANMTAVEERLNVVLDSRAGKLDLLKSKMSNRVDSVTLNLLERADKMVEGAEMAGGFLSGDLVEHDEKTNAVKWGLANQSRKGKVFDKSVKEAPAILGPSLKAIEQKGKTRGAYDEEIARNKALVKSAREKAREIDKADRANLKKIRDRDRDALLGSGDLFGRESRQLASGDNSLAWEAKAVALENTIKYLEAKAQEASVAWGEESRDASKSAFQRIALVGSGAVGRSAAGTAGAVGGAVVAKASALMQEMLGVLKIIANNTGGGVGGAIAKRVRQASRSRWGERARRSTEESHRTSTTR